MFFFIITFIFLCCTSLHSSVGKPNFENGLNSAEEYQTCIQNFAFLLKTNVPLVNCTTDQIFLFEGLCEEKLISTASGFVFSHDKDSVFILTAGHFCEQEKEMVTEQKFSGYINDEYRDLYYIHHDLELDACLLMGIRYNDEKFNKIKFVKKLPELGEEVYIVAAPQGIAGPGLRPVFTGHFAGCDHLTCMTTIPATFGSSGAGIFTKEGELISIVMAVSSGFDNVMITPSHEKLKEYIMILDETVDIY